MKLGNQTDQNGRLLLLSCCFIQVRRPLPRLPTGHAAPRYKMTSPPSGSNVRRSLFLLRVCPRPALLSQAKVYHAPSPKKRGKIHLNCGDLGPKSWENEQKKAARGPFSQGLGAAGGGWRGAFFGQGGGVHMAGPSLADKAPGRTVLLKKRAVRPGLGGGAGPV